MNRSQLIRGGLVSIATLLALAPAAASLAQAPANPLNGVYRGTITEGANAGVAIVITVFALRPDHLSIKSNRPTVPDSEVDVKTTGDTIINVEGDGRVHFDMKASPVIELTYKPRAGITFVGKKG